LSKSDATHTHVLLLLYFDLQGFDCVDGICVKHMNGQYFPSFTFYVVRNEFVILKFFGMYIFFKFVSFFNLGRLMFQPIIRWTVFLFTCWLHCPRAPAEPIQLLSSLVGTESFRTGPLLARLNRND
jgi:hypothetical protein